MLEIGEAVLQRCLPRKPPPLPATTRGAHRAAVRRPCCRSCSSWADRTERNTLQCTVSTTAVTDVTMP